MKKFPIASPITPTRRRGTGLRRKDDRGGVNCHEARSKDLDISAEKIWLQDLSPTMGVGLTASTSTEKEFWL